MSTTEEAVPTIADVDKLVGLDGRPGARPRASRSSTTTSRAAARTRSTSCGGATCTAPCASRPLRAPASRDDGIVREWRIIEALSGTDVPCTEAVAVCTDPTVLGRTFYLMGFVDGWSPMQMRREWPAPFDTDVEERRGLAFQLVEGIALLGNVDWRAKGLAGPGPARRLPRAPGRPLDRVPRTHQGPRAPRFRRGVGLAAGAPTDRLHPRAHARRLPVRQRHVQARCAGAPGRHRGLGDGHRRRSQARPGLGGAGLARGHHGRRGPGRGLRRHVGHAVTGRDRRALRQGVGPPGRRHGLLRGPGQVEAGRRAGTGLPAGRGRREAAGVRADRARPHGEQRPTWPRRPTTPCSPPPDVARRRLPQLRRPRGARDARRPRRPSSARARCGCASPSPR